MTHGVGSSGMLKDYMEIWRSYIFSPAISSHLHVYLAVMKEVIAKMTVIRNGTNLMK